MAEKKTKEKINLHKGHREKYREKFLKTGLKGFSKHNILEFLLFYSIPRADTNEIAHRLINEFGSLKGVLDAPVEALQLVEGVGANTAILIKLIPAMIKEYIDEDASRSQYIFSTQDAVNFLSPKFIGLRNEAIYLICLDKNGKILKHCFIGQGGIDSMDFDARTIAADVLACNATTVVIAHNHPGGVCSPSKADADTTIKLKSFLNTIDVELADHIIFASEGYFSFLKNPKYSYVLSHRNPFVQRQ